MKKSGLISIAILVLFCFGCDKNNEDDVHIHCDNLVNETIPASDQGRVYVTSAFTPNSDGLNDLFRPLTIQISSIKVKVYDKNSTLVFQTDQIGAGWNPGIPTSDNQTYYYRVEAVTMNNTKIGICGVVKALFCLPLNTPITHFNFEDQFTPFGFTGVTSERIVTCN